MNTRIKKVRSDLKLSMQKFGARVGISATAVMRLETGENNPSEQTIRAICSEFNVNRTWLETGEGETYKQSALIPELMRVVQASPNLQEILERVFSEMSDAEWQAFDDFLGRITKKEP